MRLSARPAAASAPSLSFNRHFSLLPLLFLSLFSHHASCAPSSSSLPTRPAPGLPSNGLSSNGIALGFLPDWSVEGPRELNAAMGGGMAAIGDYINVSPDEYEMRQFDYHQGEVLQVVRGSVKAVYAPAVLFSGTVDQWTDDMSRQLASKCRRLNDRGVTVWVRWLFEMNGGWMSYGLQPSSYVSKWRSMANILRTDAPNGTYLLWAPNVWSGDVDDASQGYMPYWPGEEYVDLAGLSLYSFGPYKSINKPPTSSAFRDSLQSFYQLLAPSSSSQNRLSLSQSYPIIITETAAPYYYTIPPSSPYYTQAGDTDIRAPQPNLSAPANRELYKPALADPPYEGSDDELFIKGSWLAQLTGNATAQRFPNLRLVNHFNYLKKGNGSAEVLSDFRLLGGNATVEQWVRSSLGNESAYEAGYTGAASVPLRGGGAAVALLVVAAVILLT
ncbi:hypothetical protein JCM10213_000779 [Rhodosporidiobolus nylandii]